MHSPFLLWDFFQNKQMYCHTSSKAVIIKQVSNRAAKGLYGTKMCLPEK